MELCKDWWTDFRSRSICGSQQSLNHLEVCCTWWRLRTPDCSVALLLSTNTQLMLVISQHFWIIFTEKWETMIVSAFPAMTFRGRTRLRHLTPTMTVCWPGRRPVRTEVRNDWVASTSFLTPTPGYQIAILFQILHHLCGTSVSFLKEFEAAMQQTAPVMAVGFSGWADLADRRCFKDMLCL